MLNVKGTGSGIPVIIVSYYKYVCGKSCAGVIIVLGVESHS